MYIIFMNIYILFILTKKKCVHHIMCSYIQIIWKVLGRLGGYFNPEGLSKSYGMMAQNLNLCLSFTPTV